MYCDSFVLDECVFFCLMSRRPTSSTLTDTLCPYTARLRAPAGLPGALYCTAHIGDHAQRQGGKRLGLEVVAEDEARHVEIGLAASFRQIVSEADKQIGRAHV